MKKVYFFIGMLLFVSVSNVNAQLMQWNTYANAGTETTEPSTSHDANLAATNLTQGSITAASNSNRFGGTNWFNTGNNSAGNTLAQAIEGNDYIQFIITPNTGYSFTPTSLVFTWDRSSTGPSSVALRSSVDAYATDLGTVTGMSSAGTSTTTTRTITISALTDISSATTFRLYGYAATATGGSGGFDNASSVVNVQLNGTTTAVSLPITINYFNGTKQGINHLLNWKVTCTNTSSAIMTLERSADSRNFISINSITADAVRCNQPFSYTDVNPIKGMNYYRLKLVDADGKISYSSIVALLNAVKGFDIVSIAPNPVVTDNFKLNIACAQASKIEVSIYDMQGRLVNRQSLNLIAGFNSLPVNVASLSSGSYTIRGSINDDKTRVMRFVKE